MRQRELSNRVSGATVRYPRLEAHLKGLLPFYCSPKPRKLTETIHHRYVQSAEELRIRASLPSISGTSRSSDTGPASPMVPGFTGQTSNGSVTSESPSR